MPKFELGYETEISYSVQVEAESRAEAQSKAEALLDADRQRYEIGTHSYLNFVTELTEADEPVAA
jgi:hypothetical protein